MRKEISWYDAVYHEDRNSMTEIRIFQKAAEYCSDKKVLDIGCGVGYLYPFIIHIKQDYFGVDFSSEAIARAKRKFHSGLFSVLDVEKEKPDFEYDIAVMIETVEHCNPESVFKNLCSGKECFISVPNFDSASHVWFAKDVMQAEDVIGRFVETKESGTIEGGRFEYYWFYGTIK